MASRVASNSVVNFPAFRQHETARKEANSSIMALLVGSRMAAHLLGLTAGSQQLLPAIFPAVAHVGRFNLTPDKARQILLQADTHLGTMAVPYALAIHEDFLRSCLKLLSMTADAPAAQLHTIYAARTGGRFEDDALAQFHVIREMRNTVIHLGGRVDDRLIRCVEKLPPSAEVSWQALVGRSPRGLKLGGVVELGVGELFLTLAATKNLARQANRMLVSALTTAEWADLIVQDFRDNGPSDAQRPQRRRKLQGWRRFHYGPTTATDADLDDAAERQQLAL